MKMGQYSTQSYGGGGLTSNTMGKMQSANPNMGGGIGVGGLGGSS